MCDEHKECQDTNPLEGKYANYFEVGYNAFEFILDFGQLYSEGEKVNMHTRIITSPVFANAFLKTLRNSIDQYERSFGAVQKEAE